jgi:hypothetical protein
MDLLGQINYGEMLSGLIVTTFLILLDASVVVVCSMVMFPLIDLAFKKKAKPAPRPAHVETWQHDGLTAHAQLSGQPGLVLRSDFLRPDAVPNSQLPLVGMAHHALAHPPLEHITPLIVRSLVPMPTGPVTADAANLKLWTVILSSRNLFSAKGRPGPPGDPNKDEPGRPSWAA